MPKEVYIYKKGVSVSLLFGAQNQIHFLCLGFQLALRSLFTDGLTGASQIKVHRVRCMIATTVSLIAMWT